jgi:hypothetical protein
MVRLPINVLPTSGQPFPIILLASISSTRADAPLIQEEHIYLLGVQYPVSFSNGLAVLPPYHELSDSIFGDDLGAMQTLARAAGFLTYPPHVTRFQAALPRVPAVRSISRNRPRLCCAPPSHLGDSRREGDVKLQLPGLGPRH